MAKTGGAGRIFQIISSSTEPEGNGGGTRDERLARKPLNDIGNSERFRARYGADFLFVEEIGWHAWVRTHFSSRDGNRMARLAAKKTVGKIREEAAAAGGNPDEFDKTQVAELFKWAVKSGNAGPLEAMLKVSEPELMRHPDELDGDALLLNCENGTLRLGAEFSDEAGVKITLQRHMRRDLCTRILPIGYDPKAVCPRFDEFIAEVLPDPDVRRWVQKFHGYALTGSTEEHILAAFWGDGRNGKSTLVKLFQWLGGDYAGTIAFASILSDGLRRGGEATPDLAKLAGRRLVFASEPKKGSRLDDGRVKEITSGDVMPVRFLNREFFDLVPSFKLILTFNNKPNVSDDSHGMWSRVRLIPFSVVIDDGRRDPHLLDKLKAEGPGVLNWALDGYQLWREEGLDPPAAIAEATGEYRKENDRIGQYLDEATVRADVSHELRAADLYACYQGWCTANEVKPYSLTRFGKELDRRKIPKRTSNGTWRMGLKWSGKTDWEWQAPYG